LDVEPDEVHKLITEALEKNAFSFLMIRDWIGSVVKPLEVESYKRAACRSPAVFLVTIRPRLGIFFTAGPDTFEVYGMQWVKFPLDKSGMGA
jgi:hypothetical protein